MEGINTFDAWKVSMMKMSVLKKFRYFSSTDFFQVSISFNCQYFSSIKNISTFKYEEYEYLSSLKSINPLWVWKVSVFFKHQCSSSISIFLGWRVLILFKNQSINTSQVSLLFKCQKYRYIINIKSVNMFQESKGSILLK